VPCKTPETISKEEEDTCELILTFEVLLEIKDENHEHNLESKPKRESLQINKS
jgi:hypothetical protein